MAPPTGTADGHARPVQEGAEGDGRSGLTDDRLSPEVAARHLRLDVGAWEGIYVVGDVHGCRAELEALLTALDPAEEDLVLFVGDLIRKGPDSLGVVELVRDTPNAFSIQGNNEAKLVHDRVDVPELDPVADYVESLPVVISFDDAFLVHGGVDTRLPLAEQGIERLLNTRSIPPENGYDGPFWFEAYGGPERVFFGHTVFDAPVVTEHAVGLDTGCVYGGSLTAYDYRADEVLSVPAFETYQSRPDRKVLDLPGIQAEATPVGAE
jgi:serine/threonine protein phosphatase 1